MIQSGKHLCFPLQSANLIGIIGYSDRQNLNSDIAPQLQIFGPIDLAHPADAKKRKNLVGADLLAEEGLARVLSYSVCRNLKCSCGPNVVVITLVQEQL